MPRFVFASSCSMYGAAGATTRRRGAPLQPVTPYGESKVRAEEACASSPDDGFSPVSCATRPPTASRRACGSTSCSTTSSARPHDRRDQTPERRTPWRPLVHIRDIAHAFARDTRAPRRAVHEEAFNIGTRRRRTTGSATSPRSSSNVMPGCRVTFAEGAEPIRGATGWTSGSSRALPRVQNRVDGRARRRELAAAYARPG